MKSVLKLIRRFVGILLLSMVTLVILNFAVLVLFAIKQKPNSSPWITAQETAEKLKKADSGFILSEDQEKELKEENIWGILIDNDTHHVVWRTENLPETIPLQYTISEIADLTRGYVEEYPTFTGETKYGLVVLGYPRESFWKHMWPSWDYDLIAGFPRFILSIVGINVTAIFMIYAVANTKMLKSVKPIALGIQDLPTGDPVHVREEGILSELAQSINRTSEVLQSQNYQLRKKENARANWIAGVSHDIRTPLSMVMGYAAQLEREECIPYEARKKAAVIRTQSERIRSLIQDLNLASKLEYNMQPIQIKKENIVSIVRQVAVDFINMDIHEKYPLAWTAQEGLNCCMIGVDRELIKRAVGNLLQNSMNHNEQGCSIYAAVSVKEGCCCISVEDDGVGISKEQAVKLNKAPHYMVCDENTLEQRHGLGLLIVRQIMASHGGKMSIGQSLYGGFSVRLMLPIE